MTQEPNIPKAILAKAQRLAPVLGDYFPKGSIKMGGGTILQARWQHRISTHADFFVFPQEFNKVVGERGGELESSIYALSGVNTHRSWLADTTKPLIGVDSPPSHSELALEVCDFLQRRIDRLLGR